MTTPTRDFTITYGSVTVGGATRPLDSSKSPTAVIRNHEEFVFEFDFLVIQDSPANFASECATVEDAFRTPNQNLTVSSGDINTNSNIYSFSHADGSGFDSFSEITKQADLASSGHSRRYSVRITIQLPANQLRSTNGRLGRRNSSVRIEYSPSRLRTVSITGTYTGVPGSANDPDARDQYDAQIGAYTLAVLTGIDSTHTSSNTLFELISETTFVDNDSSDGAASIGKGRVIEFTRVYREINKTQPGATGSALDNVKIIQQALRIRRVRVGLSANRTFSRPGVGDGPITAVETPEEGSQFDVAEISYTCSIDRTLETDLKGFYDATIRSYLITQGRTVLNAGPIAIDQDAPEFNFDENTIDVTMVLAGTFSGRVPFFRSVTAVDRLESGRIAVGAWTGDIYSKYVYPGPAKRTRRVTVLSRVRGLATGNPLPRGSLTDLDDSDAIPFGSGFLIAEREFSHRPIRRGVEDNGFDVTEIQEVALLEYFSNLPDTGVPTEQAIGDDLNEIPAWGFPQQQVL